VAQATAIGRDSDIAFAIYWSNGWNNHIINMSLSSQDPSKLSMTKDAIDHGHDTWGIVYVGASGNDSYEGVNYPANWSNVIAVGGSTSNDTKDSYSNYGSGLDVAAPTSALSTDIDVDGLIGLQLHTYMWARGTSQSAALVSGLAGLILSIRPDLVRSNPEEVRNLINSNADKVGGYDYNPDFGPYDLLEYVVGIVVNTLSTLDGQIDEIMVFNRALEMSEQVDLAQYNGIRETKLVSWIE